jgi:hypothetical protein
MKHTRKHRKQRGGRETQLKSPSKIKKNNFFPHVSKKTVRSPKTTSRFGRQRSLPNLLTKTHKLTPIYKIDRLIVQRDVLNKDENTVWIFNLPVADKKSRSLQNGGTHLDVLEKMSLEEIKEHLIRPSGLSCTIKEHKDNNTCGLQTNHMQNEVLSFGKGGFNAVFSHNLFADCDSTKQVLRISIKSLDTNNYDNKIEEAIYEIYYSLIAAESEIGPQIYKFGSMVDRQDPTKLYIYIVMDLIDG